MKGDDCLYIHRFGKQKRKPTEHEMAKDFHIVPRKTSKEEAIDKEREARFSKLDAWKVSYCMLNCSDLDWLFRLSRN